MKKFYSLFAAIVALLSVNKSFAANGDTVHVVSHQDVIMTTDTAGSGSQEKKRWATFPAAGTSYRKAIAVLTYKRPSGLTCGEWDYIDRVILHRVGGVNGADQNIELVRYITPYGLQFPVGWTFAWHSDVTDFASFLHDSVEIGYVHTGYETSSGRGWDVTIDFNMIEGPWITEPVAFHKLWNGSFAFGNDNDPIENHLTPITQTFDANAQRARVRIVHTGHGSDNIGCSEFCDRYRDLLWDNNLVDEFHLWRKCGFNALPAQGGTWVYDRGNWCPGSVIYPYVKDFDVAGGSSHTVDINMEPYSSPSPSANEVIESFLFETKSPTLQNDMRVDEIFRPSNISEYNRINPVCDDPMIQVTNVGTNAVTNMQFDFGYDGQNMFHYYWSGSSIAPGQTDTITLPGTVMPTIANQRFTVNISSVNNQADAYPQDNISSSTSSAPVATENTLYLELKTNNVPEQNAYTLTDNSGNTIFHRDFNTMTANTVYKDTFHLEDGRCYHLVIQDEAPGGGNGLDWWAATADGTGYVRLRKVSNGGYIKNFSADFGSRIEYNFAVGTLHSDVNDNDVASFNVNVFPNPTDGKTVIDYSSPDNNDWLVQVFDMLGREVYRHDLKHSFGEMLPLDLSSQPAGLYTVRVRQGANVLTRRLSVVR